MEQDFKKVLGELIERGKAKNSIAASEIMEAIDSADCSIEQIEKIYESLEENGIEVTNDRIGDHDILSMVMQSDIEKIRLTMEETDQAQFQRAVDAIAKARHIYILGVRSAAAIASFMGFYFTLIFNNVTIIHTTSASEVFEQLLHVGPEDVVLGISFPRYSRRTVKAMQFAHDRGAEAIAITDSATSPLAPYSTITLLAKSDMASFVDSLVAPLSLVNALIVAIGRKKNDDLSRTFESLERIWDEYEVYEKVDENS